MTGSHSGYRYGVLEVFLRFIPEHNFIRHGSAYRRASIRYPSVIR